MSLFPNRSRPRSIQDIWIGKSHMVEILFHLRRNDYDWYNDNSIEIEEEIFDLLSDSIIPRMFGDIIEKYHAKRHPELFPDIVVDDDNKNGIGSKNIAKNSNYAKNKKQQQQQRKKKGGGGKGKKSSAASTIDSSNDDNKKPDKDVYYSFGETVQLAYRKVPLSSPPIRTIFFKDNNNNKTDDDDDDDGEKKQGGSKKRDNKGNKKQQQLKDDDDYDDDEDQQNNKKKRKRKQQQQQQQGPILMESRIKLPSKLLIWVSQIVDPNNKTNPDPSNVGFYRPEMIPICDIFREPKEEEEETI